MIPGLSMSKHINVSIVKRNDCVVVVTILLTPQNTTPELSSESANASASGTVLYCTVLWWEPT